MPTYVTRTVAAPLPNLENLRKQAKLYLRWHRDGHYPVAAQIRAVLPRFHGLSDHEVLQQSLKRAEREERCARPAVPRGAYSVLSSPATRGFGGPARRGSRAGRRSRQESKP